MLTRRSLFLGLVAAPAVVRASSLMPIKSILGLRNPIVWLDPALSAEDFLAFQFQKNLIATLKGVSPLPYSHAGQDFVRKTITKVFDEVYGPYLYPRLVVGEAWSLTN